jgi:hypothetical protein
MAFLFDLVKKKQFFCIKQSLLKWQIQKLKLNVQNADGSHSRTAYGLALAAQFGIPLIRAVVAQLAVKFGK